MKIIVFGASGRMGKLFVEQALAAGHTVSAFFRTPAKLTLAHSNLSLIQGDALNPNLVKKALSGQDVVVSALGPSRPYAPEMFATISDNITTAMQTLGIRRLIFSSGTIMADPQDQLGIVDRLFRFMARQSGREVVSDIEKSNNLIRTSGLDWTIARFPIWLTDGPRTGKYQVGYLGKDSSLKLSRADGADFMLRALTGGEFICKAPVVSY